MTRGPRLPGTSAPPDLEIGPGDELEGTSSLSILVRVEAVDGDQARCWLVRSKKQKTISVRRLRDAYKVVKRAPRPAAAAAAPNDRGDG
jgi:hypothetical protein